MTLDGRPADRRAVPLFEQFLEFAPDAVVCADQDGRIVLVNQQTENLFGYERDELMGQPVEVLVPERYRGGHVGHRTGYFSDSRTRPMGAELDLYGLRRDGTEFPAEISLSAIQTENGRLATAAIRDVTDRRRGEQSQARLAAIVASSEDAIVGKTLDGVVTDWNHGAERLFGLRGRGGDRSAHRHHRPSPSGRRRGGDARAYSRGRAGGGHRHRALAQGW